MSDSDEFDEFDELIDNCQKIEDHANESLDILHSINEQMNDKMNDKMNEILNKLHADAISGKNTFFDSILEAIDS